MAEEEKNEEEKQVVVAPQSAQEFFWAHFNWFVVFLAALMAGAFIPINGVALISSNQMIIGLAVLIVVFVILPMMVFFKRKSARVSEITPVDPLEEMGLLQEKYARAGRDIRLLWNDSDPWEGEGAGQPEVFQYFGHEVLADGTRVPIVLAQGGITKLPTKLLPRRYIETATFSAAGTRKRPTEPGPRQVQPLVVSRPAPVQFIIPERKPVAGEEKEEEGEEGE